MPPKRPKKKTTTSSKQVIGKSSQENVRDTVILFVDIMGASEVSNHKSPEYYFKFVREFQTIFQGVCRKHLSAWYPKRKNYHFQARGDEGVMMIYPEEEQDKAGPIGMDVDVAVNIALVLKRKWISSKWNIARINDGQLPIGIGIGIHLGPTHVRKEKEAQHPIRNPYGLVPEGYAINLAKRIESHSRVGKYTNIFVSEAAHEAWRNQPDEDTYIFDEQQLIPAKGILGDIYVFEVKHHHLPTDWTDESKKSRRERTLLDPKDFDLKLLKKARALNPTNLWLTEECIQASMLRNYYSRSRPERKEKRARAFQEARDMARSLADSYQRDAGMLFIQGLVEGECLEFASEREKYDEALKYSPHLANAYWYKAQSYSYEVAYAPKHSTEKSRDKIPKPLGRDKPADEGGKDSIDKALKCFKEANARSFNSAWILYDWGCEIIRWAEDDEALLNAGIEKVELASNRFPGGIADAILKETYLDKVREDDRIKRLMSKRPL